MRNIVLKPRVSKHNSRVGDISESDSLRLLFINELAPPLTYLNDVTQK